MCRYATVPRLIPRPPPPVPRGWTSRRAGGRPTVQPRPRANPSARDAVFMNGVPGATGGDGDTEQRAREMGPRASRGTRGGAGGRAQERAGRGARADAGKRARSWAGVARASTRGCGLVTRARAGAGRRPGRSRGCPRGRDADLRVVRSPGAGRAAVTRHTRGAARPVVRGRPAGGGPAHGRDLQPAPALALRLGQRGEGDDPVRAAAQAAAGAQGAHVRAAGAGHRDDHRVRQRGRVAAVGPDRPAEPCSTSSTWPRCGRPSWAPAASGA